MSDFSPEAISFANDLAKKTRTPEAKAKMARLAERHIEGCLIYLGAALGPAETAMMMYRFGDIMAELAPPPTIEGWPT